MKKLFALLIVLLLAACSGPALQKLPEAPITPISAPQTVVTTPEPAPVLQMVDYSMDAVTRDKLMAAFSKTTKYAVSETYMQLGLGSHHTFGVAFTNRFTSKDNYLVDVKFKKAYDKSANDIDGVTAVQVGPWLAQNDFSVTPLKPEEQSVQPVVIEVTKFANGATPPKGTYIFTLNVLHQGDDFQVDQPVSGEIELNIQVV